VGVHALRQAPAKPRVAPPAPRVRVGQPAAEPAPELQPRTRPRPAERVWPRISPRTRRLVLGGLLLVGAAIRVWEINAVGLNSDEAVYAGQGASIAGNADLAPYFPTFRAHPLLFQTMLSFGFHLGHPELFGRLLAAAAGVGTIYVAYLLGRLLYGSRAGLIAAAIMALMPYHVVVTRQILLDGPRTLMSTLTLYFLARYALTERRAWFHAAAAALGLTFLCKEDSVILLGAVYAFLALTPALRTGLRHFVVAGALFALIAAALPVALNWAGRTGTGGHFVAWQLFRRPNHSFLFYPTVVTVAVGVGVVAAAGAGLWLLRRDGSWRETVLLAWIAVPVAFYQLFPVKGFQYLLPIAPAVAVLAARFFAHWDARTLPARSTVPFLRGPWTRRAASSLGFLRTRRTVPIALALVLLSLAVPSWQRVQQSHASTFLAGSGGLPGGRDAGRWIAAHVPARAQMMSVGPSMANVLQYYGHRKVYGLSVSPNPLHRNPVYQAMRNPDRLIRDNELQYIVWDAFSAARSPFFARKLIRYVERFQGHVAYSVTVQVRSAGGRRVRKPLIVIYEVSP
jgi:dolichyl-phosphate-mannose-protein mannosyltransferase